MPKLNRELIRSWLEDHNWTIARLTAECNAMGDDTFSEGTVRNAMNGIDPMRPGRIKVICRVLSKYGDGVPYERLTERAATRGWESTGGGDARVGDRERVASA